VLVGKVWGVFFTGRATGEELTERACQRRVGDLGMLVGKVLDKEIERVLRDYYGLKKHQKSSMVST